MMTDYRYLYSIRTYILCSGSMIFSFVYLYFILHTIIALTDSKFSFELFLEFLSKQLFDLLGYFLLLLF